MEEKHRFILRHHWSNIRENLEPKNILPTLVTVLNETDEKEIKAQSTIQERCDKLLEILPRRGRDAFTAFVDALVKEAPHLALDLIKAEKGLTEEDLGDARAQSAKLRRDISDLKIELEAEKQDIETLKGVKEKIVAGGFQEKETSGGPFIPWQSESVAGDSNTRDLTKIILERDELKKQCESLAKHFKEAQRVVSNLEKRLTTTFHDRATSTRDLEEFDRTDGTTEHDLCADAREHSEKLRGEIRQFKTELEAEKQNHKKTSQELEELKIHDEISKTKTSELTDLVQQLRDERDSAARENQTLQKKIQKWKTKSKECELENQVLPESLESAMEIQGTLELLSSDLETANKEQQEQIRHLQRMNAELQDKVTNENERDSAARENQSWEQENQELQKSLERAMEKQRKLELLSNDHERANKAQQEQIRELLRMNEELHDKVTNEKEQHTVERDSVLKENQSLQKTIQVLKNKNKNCQREYQKLKERQNTLKMSKKPEAVKETQQKTAKQLQRIEKITKLGDKVTKQKSELACKKRKEMTAAKRKELESETKANTSLQAQVVELENKLKNCQMQMSEQEKRFREETNTERFKSDRLEEEVSGLKSRLRETIGPGRIYSYSNDFDTCGVVYALARKTSSFGAGIIATRSCGNTGAGEPKDILEHQVKGGTVCATSYVKDSWWCVDLTDKYALYLTHYTLRHGQEQQKAFLRHWRLEGSLDGAEWTTLKEHENDTGLIGNKRYCTYTWAITGKFKAFRYFRIFQTGWHSSGNFGIFLSGIEMYGVLVEISS